MSIDLDARLVETATKITISRNEFNDTIWSGATSSSACLYRDISTLNQIQNREDVSIDGILWFGASESVLRGDVYYHPSEGYLRIEKVTRAKRLVADNSTQFIRTEVTKIRQTS